MLKFVSVKGVKEITEITINIPDEKLTVKQKQWVEDFRISLDEVELHLQGKIKLKSAQEVLDEL